MTWFLIELLSKSSKVLRQWKEGLWICVTVLVIDALVETTRDQSFLLLNQKRINAFNVEHVLVSLVILYKLWTSDGTQTFWGTDRRIIE